MKALDPKDQNENTNNSNRKETITYDTFKQAHNEDMLKEIRKS